MSERKTIRCLTINTHRGRGPKLPYLLAQSPMDEAERIALLHEMRVYTFYIADWLHKHRHEYDVVGLQEVFNGILGLGDKLFRKFRQRDHYRLIGGFRSTISHGVGFAGFRYENLMLSQLQVLAHRQINYLLPGKIAFLAASGFTLAPFVFNDEVVWIGNTHLHPYNPSDRARQVRSIAEEVRKLNGAPVLFMGDLNTVPPGCRVNGFPAGARDEFSYKNDKTFEIFSEVGLSMVPHADADEFYTYPTGLPNRTLDYVLFSDHWEVVNYHVVKEFKFSDHYPVFGEFRLKD
ncbi:Endonuclease/exonuclease/phosphatase [Chloroherpeton thalassium ATCC 35110]|uniref:Endonuclease/exonuclease/phosphatase n=1 Tax=Chloroherpeton thalassium (strain ATCC 35110 / GB-78) TaxID=517418 RepID=B3QY60_CHLT3|nr:endonuclease/exonuclease/phosphatase family protein [Chloroherpeton thalassium]ACF15026.1 Endonuclease/exonuclease/phosphatase [Chloroherpeton thalassium ATCC 35110]